MIGTVKTKLKGASVSFTSRDTTFDDLAFLAQASSAPTATIPFAQPFSWRSFYQLSCKHRGRSSHLRAFGIETVFRPCSRGGGLSNDNNTSKKETRVSWNTFGNLNFSPDLVTLTSQLIHSHVPPRSWEHIFLDSLTNGLPEAWAPLTGTPQGRARGSGETRRELGPITSAPQLP